MPRFFIENQIDPSEEQLVLQGADYHHIRDVLRLTTGDQITVCDGARNDLICRIERFDADSIKLSIQSRQENQSEPPYQVTLYQGLAKGDKMDIIIQKAVELGVSRLVPVSCRRSVVRLDDRDADRKQQRWQRIAVEAAKQCGRGQIPEIGKPLPFLAAAAAASEADIRLIPWEGERDRDLRTELEMRSEIVDPQISILIGPEGGFDADEVDAALKLGIRPVTLGRRILRTETAGTAVLAMLIYAYRDF